MTPAPAMKPVWRVRARATGMEGSVIDVMDDGWIVWVGTDKSCHISRPDFVETVMP